MLYLELLSHGYLDEYKRVLELKLKWIMKRFGELKSNLTDWLKYRNIFRFVFSVSHSQHLELTLAKWVYDYFPIASII